MTLWRTPSALLCSATLALAQVAPPVPGPRPVRPQPPSGTAPKAAAATSEGITLQFTAAPLAEVIELYQDLIGKRIIRDPKLESATVSIETSGELSKVEAIEFIEKTLLLAGYSFVPSGPNMLKLLASEQGRMPGTEGVPMILRESELPTTDQVVSFVLQLEHLKAEESATAFQQIVPLHPYGKMTAVPNAKSLVITEASNTIRAFIELAKQVDLPPGETKHKTIHLERADAEDVAQQLGTLLGIETGTTGSSNYSSGGAARPATPPPATNPQQRAAQAAAQVNSTTVLGGGTSEAAAPKIQPIARTNSLLIVARPLDIEYIESLVAELDAESPTRGFVSRRLNYIDLTTFLDIAGKALLRNDKNAQGGSGTSGTGNQTTTTTTQAGNTSSGFGSSGFGSGSGSGSQYGMGGYGSGGMGGYGGGGMGSGGFGSSGGSVTPLEITKKAGSVLIGKTLVIVDPGSSKFFASGPPEELRMLNELADELDVRPRQILLSAIIGEFTLGDDFNFGLDWINTIQSVGNEGQHLVGGILNTQGTAFADLPKLGGVGDFIAENGPAALSGLTAYGQIGKHLNVFLNTLESSNRFHVLQKPTLFTMNHQPATIYIGQQIAIAGQTYTTGTGGVGNNLGFTSTTQYIPVRLQLDITPHIFNDEEVMLEFKQQNNDVSGFSTISGNRVPNIHEQGMQNSLIVPDRTTAMLGGLITERDTNDKTGLPFLMRVPIIKHLFGSTTKNKQRRELMIFVQPRILADGESHIVEQADLSKSSEVYQPALRFASPQETTPLDALPPSDGRLSKPGDASPLLPLPNWHGPAPKQPLSTDTQSATEITPPKAELVDDDLERSSLEKAKAMMRKK